MALRAGYYGVKRKIWEALQVTTAKNERGIKDLWSNNTVMGAKNLLKHTISGKTDEGVVWTYGSNGEVIANSDSAATGNSSFNEPVALKAGKYIVSGCPAGGSTSKYTIRIAIGSAASTAVGWDNGSGFELTLDSDATVYIQSQIRTGYTANNVTFKPMVRLADDPNSTYAPYAMTNQQLTASADDQKTAINAIITAATGAADFAAFKTAMSAITPVTRSVAPDERLLDVEEPELVVKKSTRKKTTKTEEEE